MTNTGEEPTSGGELIARGAPGAADLLEDAVGEDEAQGRSGGADILEATAGVLTLVCFTCGSEAHFVDSAPPPGISCGRCGGTVFRDFYTPTSGMAAAQDFEDSTARDLDADDAEGETQPSDIIDLNRD